MPRAAFKQIGSFGANLPREASLLEQNLRQKFAADDAAPTANAMTQTPTIVAAYTARFGELVRVDPTTGAFTVTLPDPGDPISDVIRIVNVGTSGATVTLAALNSSSTVNGVASYIFAGTRATITLWPDRLSSDWAVFA